jgi:subtilase family serine protease
MTTIGRAMGSVLVAALVAGCGGTDEDTAKPNAQVPFALVLETDTAAFDRAVASTYDATAPADFLTLDEISTAYGASPDVVEAATKEMRDRGVEVRVDPSGAALWGTVEVADAEDLFGVEFETQQIDGGGRSIRATGTPKVPDGVDGVRAVVGLSATMGAERLDGGDGASTTTSSTTASSAPASSTTTSATTSTTTASSTGPLPACPGGEVTRPGLAQSYGAEAPVAQGATGAGVTVAMIEIQSFDDRVFQTYDGCVGDALDAERITQVTVEPAPRPTPGSEVALDTVAVGLLAPSAEQQLTRFDPESSIVFPLRSILDAAAGQGRTPEVLLLSVGFCEIARSAEEIELGERLLAAFALSGTTSVASSGDLGSSSCHPGTDDPAVQYPTSSAWVTSIGGADFDGTAAQPAALEVWNSAPGSDNAGGGGISTKVARPAWQTGTNVDGDMRVVPDVAAFAEPSGVGLFPTCDDDGCAWQGLGGTSLSGAAVAGALALLLEAPDGADAARRVGHLAPLLPGTAGQVTTDITAGDNHVFTERCCTAAAGYDPASGWGLVDLPGLVGSAGARG